MILGLPTQEHLKETAYCKRGKLYKRIAGNGVKADGRLGANRGSIRMVILCGIHYDERELVKMYYDSSYTPEWLPASDELVCSLPININVWKASSNPQQSYWHHA